jgi:hypothetical protein
MKRISAADLAPQRETSYESNPYRCRVPGCQVPAAINDGERARICGLHFGLHDDEQNAITRRMKANPLLLEALLVTEAVGEMALRNLADQMIAAGMPEYAPREELEITHDGYGRHGEGVSVIRSEFDHPKLYRQRLQALVRSAR